jgi:hypothetical protein
MGTIAVGAFHDHRVRMLRHGRIMQNGRATGTKIAAEHQGVAFAVFDQGQLDDGGTHDVTRIVQGEGDTRQYLGG